jgi:hypothetical protein
MNRHAKLLTSKPQPLNSFAELTSGLRRTVFAQLMREFGVRLPPALIRRVLDEASEVAQESGFPNLFFPALDEEKARFVFTTLENHFHEETTRIFRNAA